jgi:hypothetical protein
VRRRLSRLRRIWRGPKPLSPSLPGGSLGCCRACDLRLGDEGTIWSSECRARQQVLAGEGRLSTNAPRQYPSQASAPVRELEPSRRPLVSAGEGVAVRRVCSLQPKPRPFEPSLLEGTTITRVEPNLALLMLRSAMRMEEDGIPRALAGTPRALHKRIMEPMVLVLFFFTLASAAVGGALLLLMQAAHVPEVVVAVVAYGIIFAPVATFFILNSYFWYLRLSAPDRPVRITLQPRSPLLTRVTVIAITLCAVVGLAICLITGSPF